MNPDRVRRVIERLDAVNAGDPAGRELAFADRLESWIRRLNPSPSDALRIAARGQHVRRWSIPRSDFPEGRGGYLRWREELKKLHAATVAEAMAAEGFSEDDIAPVRRIVLKRELAADPDAQVMEDALCLVFLESQFDALREKTPDDKMVEILRKTWRKMSPAARAAALALPLTPDQKALVARALA